MIAGTGRQARCQVPADRRPAIRRQPRRTPSLNPPGTEWPAGVDPRFGVPAPHRRRPPGERFAHRRDARLPRGMRQSPDRTSSSGGTGSGKTTLLNALSRIHSRPPRPASSPSRIRPSSELQQPHVAKLESWPADLAAAGAVPMGDLVRGTRSGCGRTASSSASAAGPTRPRHDPGDEHRPRQGEHLTTVHANSARDAFTRIELLIGLAGIDIPVWAIRKLVASSVHLIVQVFPAGRAGNGRSWPISECHRHGGGTPSRCTTSSSSSRAGIDRRPCRPRATSPRRPASVPRSSTG